MSACKTNGSRSRDFLLGLAFGVVSLLGMGAEHSEAVAQEAKPVVFGEERVVTSKILGEDRPIRVLLPEGYEESGDRYPVLFLLDGEAHYYHVSGIVRFLQGLGRIPELIVVALSNTERTRDLTFETDQDLGGRFPEVGGASRFVEFLQSELVPFVDEHYRTHPYRILGGHSFGGLLVTYTLVTTPDAFGGYIALSPALWWDRGSLITRAQSFFAGVKRLDKQLVMVTGGEGDDTIEGVRRFGQILASGTPEGLIWTLHGVATETRVTIPHRGFYDALERLYGDWVIADLPSLLRNSGIEGVDEHYRKLTRRYGYDIPVPEGVVNTAGYWYIEQHDFEAAIDVLKRNVKDHPQSANVYDSLGDAYDAAGQLILARHNYEKAVTIAEESDHPFLSVYRANLERIRVKIREEAPDS